MRTIIVLLPPIHLVEPMDDVLAGLLLVIRRHRIFAIEKNDVRLGLRGFSEQCRIGPRHGEFGAVQPRGGLLDSRETHF